MSLDDESQPILGLYLERCNPIISPNAITVIILDFLIYPTRGGWTQLTDSLQENPDIGLRMLPAWCQVSSGLIHRISKFQSEIRNPAMVTFNIHTQIVACISVENDGDFFFSSRHGRNRSVIVTFYLTTQFPYNCWIYHITIGAFSCQPSRCVALLSHNRHEIGFSNQIVFPVNRNSEFNRPPFFDTKFSSPRIGQRFLIESEITTWCPFPILAFLTANIHEFKRVIFGSHTIVILQSRRL